MNKKLTVSSSQAIDYDYTSSHWLSLASNSNSTRFTVGPAYLYFLECRLFYDQLNA